MGLTSSAGEFAGILLEAVDNGDAYRASRRKSLSDGEELIVHIDPVAAGGTIWLGTPRVNVSETADYDVYENADPGSSATANLNVHNMRYDAQDQPEATVTDVSNGGLNTTGADTTEQTRIDTNNSRIETADVDLRGIYRIIPTSDTISIVVTDQSGGTNNNYSIDLVVYEGATIPA